MFALAILIGIYSYLILGLGLWGVLYKNYVILATLTFVFSASYFYKNKLKMNLLQCFKTLKQIQEINIKAIKCNLLSVILIFILILQGAVNLVGALGPELGFDALWYHLTLPKIYLENHSINFLPGGLFYYSAMPKL